MSSSQSATGVPGVEYPAERILDHLDGYYLIEWARDPVTHQLWEETWEPEAFANAELLKTWSKEDDSEDDDFVARGTPSIYRRPGTRSSAPMLSTSTDSSNAAPTAGGQDSSGDEIITAFSEPEVDEDSMDLDVQDESPNEDSPIDADMPDQPAAEGFGFDGTANSADQSFIDPTTPLPSDYRHRSTSQHNHGSAAQADQQAEQGPASSLPRAQTQNPASSPLDGEISESDMLRAEREVLGDLDPQGSVIPSAALGASNDRHKHRTGSVERLVWNTDDEEDEQDDQEEDEDDQDRGTEKERTEGVVQSRATTPGNSPTTTAAIDEGAPAEDQDVEMGDMDAEPDLTTPAHLQTPSRIINHQRVSADHTNARHSRGSSILDQLLRNATPLRGPVTPSPRLDLLHSQRRLEQRYNASATATGTAVHPTSAPHTFAANSSTPIATASTTPDAGGSGKSTARPAVDLSTTGPPSASRAQAPIDEDEMDFERTPRSSAPAEVNNLAPDVAQQITGLQDSTAAQRLPLDFTHQPNAVGAAAAQIPLSHVRRSSSVPATTLQSYRAPVQPMDTGMDLGFPTTAALSSPGLNWRTNSQHRQEENRGNPGLDHIPQGGVASQHFGTSTPVAGPHSAATPTVALAEEGAGLPRPTDTSQAPATPPQAPRYIWASLSSNAREGDVQDWLRAQNITAELVITTFDPKRQYLVCVMVDDAPLTLSFVVAIAVLRQVQVVGDDWFDDAVISGHVPNPTPYLSPSIKSPETSRAALFHGILIYPMSSVTGSFQFSRHIRALIKGCGAQSPVNAHTMLKKIAPGSFALSDGALNEMEMEIRAKGVPILKPEYLVACVFEGEKLSMEDFVV